MQSMKACECLITVKITNHKTDMRYPFLVQKSEFLTVMSLLRGKLYCATIDDVIYYLSKSDSTEITHSTLQITSHQHFFVYFILL